MTSIASSLSSYSNYASIQGAQGGRPKPPDFSKLDADSSGGLSKAELQALFSDTSETDSVSSSKTDELFSKLDTDSDGSISESELKAGAPKPPSQDSSGSLASMGMSTESFASMMGPPPPPPPSLSELDSDDDGTITKSEFGLSTTSSTSDTTSSTDESKLEELFAKIDSDGDGSLSSTEVADFESAMKEAHGPQGMPPPPPPSDSEDSSSTSDTLQQLLSALDADGSGSVSDSEVTDFESKMKEVLSQLQTFANQQYQSVSSSTSLSSITSTVSLLA